MATIFIEENGVYQIDCTKSVWATNEINEVYRQAGLNVLKDADFVIETAEILLLVEYKNACIPGAASPDTFDPTGEKVFHSLVRKFYDSLHYLRVKGKNKVIWYVCVLEYPKGNPITRKKLRNRLKNQLPFQLADVCVSKISMIDAIDVVSIDEWNSNAVYREFPISRILPAHIDAQPHG